MDLDNIHSNLTFPVSYSQLFEAIKSLSLIKAENDRKVWWPVIVRFQKNDVINEIPNHW
jgi:hypothetical protein